MKQYLVADVSVAARDVTKFAHWELRKVPRTFYSSDFNGFSEGRMLFNHKGFEYHVPPDAVKVVG
jgi:hypothetical protein